MSVEKVKNFRVTISIIEVEQAWAQAQRPGPDSMLALHKPQAWKSLGPKVAKLKGSRQISMKKNLSNRFELVSKQV